MKTKKFNVMLLDWNSNKIVPYDVIPYLVNVYNTRRRKDKPKDYVNFREFVRSWSLYQFWSRCEYEMIISPWPPKEEEKYQHKVDVYQQIFMNLDVVTQVLINALGKRIKIPEDLNPITEMTD